MEEPALLLPMEGIVGGVEIQRHPLRRAPVGVHEQIDEQVLERRPFVADLVIARVAAGRGMLQPVERRLAGQRRAVAAPRLQLVREQRQHRIVPELVVVVDVLVSQRDGDDALAHQGAQRMDHVLLGAAVVEARRHPLDQTDLAVRLPEQQRPRVRSHPTAVEGGDHPAPFKRHPGLRPPARPEPLRRGEGPLTRRIAAVCAIRTHRD